MIAALHHASLLTANLPQARHFYEAILGLTPDPKRPNMSFDGVWYDLAGGQQIHLMQLPNPEAGLPRPAHGGRDRHLAFVASDFTQLTATLSQAGVAYTLSQSGRQALFCRDPDDNALEFIAP
jgi:glyoxylase I family protein